MAKFTSGNWRWNVDTAMISNDKGKPVATVYGASVYNNVTDKTEAYANARLVENAPELFGLLSIIHSDIHNGFISNVPPDIFSAIDNVLERINVLPDDGEDMSLKPCPFCDNPNPNTIEYAEQFAIECPECQCATRLCDTEQEAIYAWNRRTAYEAP